MPLDVTPVTVLKRQYPHVDDVQDWRAQQSLRLLWDRVFSLEERLQAAYATQGDLVAATNAQEDRLARVQQVAGEALAVAQGGGGAGGAGGEGGGPTGSNEFGKIGKGSAPPTVSLADGSGIVDSYASAHPDQLADSCQNEGGSWAFMNGLLAALQASDPRFGGNGKRGNTGDPSNDAISYYHGPMPPVEGSNDVYVVDVIVGHCGPDPGPAWIDQTNGSAYGAWLSSVPS